MKKPAICPYCHLGIDPVIVLAKHYGGGKYYWMFQCTSDVCKKCFIGEYESHGQDFLYKGIPTITKRKRNFSEIIREISPNFEEIYNQSYSAEQDGLNEISGGGFRKALEFLIKDYLITIRPQDEESIKNLLLGKCIDQFIDNTNVKVVSKRAAWLGNDEIHFIKKWEDKDLQDLKALIDLCVNWIEMEIQTKNLLEDMPEGK